MVGYTFSTFQHSCFTAVGICSCITSTLVSCRPTVISCLVPLTEDQRTSSPNSLAIFASGRWQLFSGTGGPATLHLVKTSVSVLLRRRLELEVHRSYYRQETSCALERTSCVGQMELPHWTA